MNDLIENYLSLLTNSLDRKSKLLKTFENSLDSLTKQYKIKAVSNADIKQVFDNIQNTMFNNPSDHALISSQAIEDTVYIFWNTLYQIGPTKRDKNILNHPFQLNYNEEQIEHYVVRRAIIAAVIHSYILKNKPKQCIIGLAEFADSDGILSNIKIPGHKIHTIPNARRGLCAMLPDKMNCKIKTAIFNNGDSIQVDVAALPKIIILHRRMRHETTGVFKVPNNSIVMGDFNAEMYVENAKPTNVLRVVNQVVVNDKPIDHIIYFKQGGQFLIRKPNNAKWQLEIERGSSLIHKEGYVADINDNIYWVFGDKEDVVD